MKVTIDTEAKTASVEGIMDSVSPTDGRSIWIEDGTTCGTNLETFIANLPFIDAKKKIVVTVVVSDK